MPKLIAVQSLPCWTDDITTPYGIPILFFCGRIVRDRFNVLNQYSKFNWADTVDPIPEPVICSINTFMDQRAQELIAQGSITAQWSGGVDSTALLLALIKNGIKKDMLQIYCDKHSIEEYPKLYDWLKDKKYNVITITNWRNALASTDADLITNGWCADQLFGSVFFHSFPQMYSLPMEEMLLKTKTPNGYLTKEQVYSCVEICKKMAKDLFGIDIVTAADLGWFINFAVKWSYVSTYNELYLAGTKNRTKTQVFYNTPYFQSWTVGNFTNIGKANIYGSDASQYKRPLKEYCYSVFADEDYLKNKTKKPSWNAAQNATMYMRRKVVFKHKKGYDIFSLPVKLPYNKQPAIETDFFTKYYK